MAKRIKVAPGVTVGKIADQFLGCFGVTEGPEEEWGVFRDSYTTRQLCRIVAQYLS